MMEPRIKNLATHLPGVQEAVMALSAATRQGGVPEATLALW